MTDGPTVQSVDRAVDLLELMVDLGGAATLTALAETSQLPLPTIHRLVRTLVSRGYMRQLASRQYTLGPRLIRLGDTASRQLGAGTQPYLERLAQDFGESANLAIFDRDMALYVAQASSSRSMRMFTEVGRRVHCHCTGVGKVLLSQLADDTIRQVVGRVGMPAATDRSIVDIDALLAAVHTIREQGYAIDDGEQEVGVRCFAVPVPGVPTPTALSLSGPEVRVPYEFGDDAVPALRAVADGIAAELLSVG